MLAFSNEELCSPLDSVEIDEEARRKSFCKDPYKVICQDNPYLSNDFEMKHENKIEQMSYDYFYYVNKELLQRHGIDGLHEGNIHRIKELLKGCFPTRAEEEGICEKSIFQNSFTDDLYSFQEVQKEEFTKTIKKRIKEEYLYYYSQTMDYYGDKINSSFDSIKDLFHDAIKEEIQNLSLSDSKRSKILKNYKNILNKTEIIFSISDKELKKAANKMEESVLYNVLLDDCGEKFHLQNGAALYEREKKYIVICPRNFIELLKSPFESTFEINSSLLHIVAHELAHHVFPKHEKDNFIPREKIYKYALCLGGVYPRGESIAKRPHDYMEEAYCDYFANKVIERVISNKNLRTKDKIDLLQLTMRGLCFVGESKKHPRGRFRIKEMLYRHPKVFNSLKCFRENQNKIIESCHLEGRDILNLGF